MEPKIMKVEKIRPRPVSLEDAACYLGLAPKTLRNRTGPRAENPLTFKPKRIGRKVVFDVRDLDKFVDGL